MSKLPEKIDFKYNLRIYFSILKKYKWTFFTLVFLILIVEAINTSTRYLFKIIIDEGTGYVSGTITRDALITVLLIIATVYLSIHTLKFFLKWINIHLLNRLDANLIFDLKNKFFSPITHLSNSFHNTHRTGSLISRLTRGGRAIEKITDLLLFNVFPIIFQIIIVTITISFFEPMSSIIILLTALLFVAYSYIWQRAQKLASIIRNDTEDFEKGNISDMFTNIDSIKHFGKEKYIIEKYSKISGDSKKAALKHWDYFRWIDAGQGTIIAIGTFFIIYFPLTKFLNNEITLGTLVLIYTLYGAAIDPLFRFVWAMREYYQVMADFESLFEYNKIEQEVKNLPGSQDLKIIAGTVEFRNIKFNYADRKIFDKFNLKIPKNKKIALVGHSGSGKTTLIKLLYRLYDVDGGNVLVDGRDIRKYTQESLRGEMSIVPQECILFDDTIYNNIAFSRPESTREEITAAIRFAQLDKIIEEFSNKEETIVGERGVKLSGGEKQRVSIARAILANKKILVLDEATSSLDSETEHEIQKDLEQLMKDRTTIIIAHRLSTIMKADRIIVMKKGEIVQAGTHTQLIKKKGEYKKLWNLQKGGYI